MRYIGWIGPLLVGGCLSATGPGPGPYRGHFARGYEQEAFHPCGRGEAWWVTDALELRRRYDQVATQPYQQVFVVVRGRVGPEGHYGHLGAYRRELAVSEVLEIRPERQGDCN